LWKRWVLSLEWKVEGVTDGENEGDDCDEVICVRWDEPGGEWTEWGWRNEKMHSARKYFVTWRCKALYTLSVVDCVSYSESRRFLTHDLLSSAVWQLLDVQISLERMFVCLCTEDSELRRTLQSLACGKARVLTKQPKVPTSHVLDFFSIFLDQ